MIKRLQRRMILLVIAVLILVSAGIVFAIYSSDVRSITAQAEASLAVMAGEDGDFSRGEMQGPARQGRNRHEDRPRREGRGQFAEIRDGREAAAAGLGNSYIITLNGDKTVASWTSERMNLYTDDQIAAVAEDIMAESRESGRIGTQFYRKVSSNGQTKLLVADARLDFLSASNTLRSAILITAAACFLLSMLAWVLVRRMVRPVKEAFIRQKQFVSDASHELKTPLAVISANAEVLEQEIGENEYLGYILSEVRRTDTLVGNLLTLARLDRNEANIEMQSFDLSHALLDVILPFESTVFEAGKTLEMDIPDGIRYTGNEGMVKQLAVILLSNALKYSDEHGRIRISLSAKGKQREIRVFNTGEPIRQEDCQKIFDRFWRSDQSHSKETGGYGLGLAIARSITDLHHGRIAVESEAGQGNTFVAILNA